MLRTLSVGALLRALCLTLMLAGPGLAWAQAKGEGVRPEVGKPLQAAQALVKQRKGRKSPRRRRSPTGPPTRTRSSRR
jgi:hypothetical protein